MVELFKQDIRTENRHSSKGNQLKWFDGDTWYKADYAGYEGLAEYVISNLLGLSTLNAQEYVLYETEQIRYGNLIYIGCSSKTFLQSGWQLITLERLFQNYYNESLYKSLYAMRNHENRIRFLVEQTERITGLEDFGGYMSKLLAIDAFFLNEDRHTHNIAVLMDGMGNYNYCPIFDNGAALLSDITMDYPLGENTGDLVGKVKAKTFCQDFEEQMEIAEQLYGQQIKFDFGEKDVSRILENEKYYPRGIKDRVTDIILGQMRKYQYLLQSKRG